MTTTTRGIGAGVHTAALNQIQNASADAPVKLDAAQVSALQTGLTKMADDLIGDFQKLKSAGDTEGMNKLLSSQTVGATIDKFVIDAESGRIQLPDGAKATDIVSDAVAKFLEAGFTYSIDFNYSIGGRTLNASLESDGDVKWDDIRMR